MHMIGSPLSFENVGMRGVMILLDLLRSKYNLRTGLIYCAQSVKVIPESNKIATLLFSSVQSIIAQFSCAAQLLQSAVLWFDCCSLMLKGQNVSCCHSMIADFLHVYHAARSTPFWERGPESPYDTCLADSTTCIIDSIRYHAPDKISATMRCCFGLWILENRACLIISLFCPFNDSTIPFTDCSGLKVALLFAFHNVKKLCSLVACYIINACSVAHAWRKCNIASTLAHLANTCPLFSISH
jgi:hypothetical protein